MRETFLILSLAVAALGASDEPLDSRHEDTHPTDVARSHVEQITEEQHRYTVVQEGTMDGRNCRSPMGCGMAREGAFIQTWESNRSVRMENVGQTDLVNPWLSNGRNNFRNVDEIVSSAVTPGMTDAEKAFALWFQEIRYRHHSPGDNSELGDPVKVFNVYGYNTCGNDSICLGTLWRAAGLETAPARALGHCISQAFYDGRWHFLDGDLHSVYLLRDNETVAGEQDLVRDHDLIKRTHSQGILLEEVWWREQSAAALYFFEGDVTGQRAGKADTTMDMVLRPGEALVWRWGQADPLKYHGMLHVSPTYKSVIFSGLWEYRPDFSQETWRHGAASVENVVTGPHGLRAEEGKTGTIIWTMRSPYVFVGGRLEADGADVRFFLSADGQTWRRMQDNLDKFFSIVGPPCYEYQLKCELAPAARLRRLAIVNDVQMAPMTLPEMVVGENTFTYSDQTAGDRKVRVTHRWVERSASRPPEAPPAPIHPPDDGEAAGTDVVFEWAPPGDPDGDAIADYHFELSNRADMKWPLSMSFYKLISRTSDVVKEKDAATNRVVKVTAKPRYTVPQPGLLTPGRTYHWRVRARDDQGVWGPWSRTWSFTPRGPAYPLHVTLDYDRPKGLGTLRWKPNPVGSPPVKYRVYGSDEKGFTIADKRYQSVVGVTKEEMPLWFPANFIAETTATELAVTGRDVTLPGANKTYYRVVAVDDQGKCSGPSDYATAPRPVIYSSPVVAATVGAEYRYQLRANRSLGDLTARMADGRQVQGYFDVEKPRFALERGPAWLEIDESTGVLRGTPDAPGKAEVVVTASIDREVRKLDEAALKWGREKVLSVTTERVGSATQEFVVEVRQQDADAAEPKKDKGLKIFDDRDSGMRGEHFQRMLRFSVDRIRPITGGRTEVLLATTAGGCASGAIVAADNETGRHPVPKEHPRLLGSRERLQRLARDRADAYQRVVRVARQGNADEHSKMISMALVSAIEPDRALGRQAIAMALKTVDGPIKKGHVPFAHDLARCAIVYDLCHEHWTPDERSRFHEYVNNTVDANVRSEPHVFHNGWYGYKNWGIGLAGYAAYHENPRAQAILQSLESEFRARAAPALELAGDGGGWAEGYYVNYWLYEWLFFCEVARWCEGVDYYAMAPGFFRNRAIASMFEAYPGIGIYNSRRPIPMGDGGGRSFGGDRDKVLSARRILVNHFREDPSHQAVHAFNETTPRSSVGDYAYKDFLWRDPTATRADLSRFRLSHVSTGPGYVYARSSWDEDATYFFFKCGDRFTAHQHLDVGHFLIYRHEELAGDGGHYDDFGSPHDVNYHLRSIAHNTILVHDPSETWPEIRAGRVTGNDGGQAHDWPHHNGAVADAAAWNQDRRLYDVADIVAFEDCGTYVYVAGDCTRAYSPDKLEWFTRQIVFGRPGTFVIFDRVRSREPQFEKTWLLQAMKRPEESPPGFVITNGNGRLFLQTLLPPDPQVKLHDGRDLYRYGGNTYSPRRDTGPAPECRIEISPSEPARVDYFLHVLTATDATVDSVARAVLEETDREVRVRVGKATISFDKSKVAGSVEIPGRHRRFPAGIPVDEGELQGRGVEAHH